jgi:malate dehydrogenase
MRKKVTVVGAGNVGATTAHWLAADELADVVLVDVVEGVPQGKSLDLAQALSIEGADVDLVGSNDYELTAGSDIVVITAGFPRKPGMSRDDLLRANAEIVSAATAAAVQRSPDTILIVVSNPLDAMCEVARRVSGFPRERVIGMAGVLDSSRFATFIARELKVSVENVTAFVLGGHGDQMVPVPRYSTVAGVPITELMDAETIERIVKRTAGGGGEIVALLKTGSAYYAPARSTAEMVGAILKNKHKIMPCAAFLQGEYGIEGLFVGVPCQLGAGGLEAIFEVKLNEDELGALQRSAAAVRELVDALPELAASR